jgi:hypothetical protein
MLMALMLGACKLLAMAKDIGGLHPIAIGEVFFQLIVPLSYNFRGRFMNTYPPISSEFRPLEAMNPSYLEPKPSSTYTLIGP